MPISLVILAFSSDAYSACYGFVNALVLTLAQTWTGVRQDMPGIGQSATPLSLDLAPLTNSDSPGWRVLGWLVATPGIGILADFFYYSPRPRGRLEAVAENGVPRGSIVAPARDILPRNTDEPTRAAAALKALAWRHEFLSPAE